MLGAKQENAEFGNNVVSFELRGKPLVARIHLLGALQATTYLGQNIVPRGRKARALLGYLCCHAGRRVPRARLASLLWDQVPDRQARTNLRQALRELIVTLGSVADELITVESEFVTLDDRSCWIDARTMLLSQPRLVHPFRADLASLCTGELLEDVYGLTPSFDEWLLAERARFTSQLRMQLEDELCRLCQTETGARQRAALARRVLAFDPTHEGASRILMRALADLGERAQALGEYERCRTAIKAAYDAEPSPETRGLYQAIKTYSGTNLNAASQDRTEVMLWPNAALQAPSPKSHRLCVGVLPFQGRNTLIENMEFSISQEIASALARFRWFDVIAPISLPRRMFAEQLNNPSRSSHLHYVVDGAVVQHGDKLQISVHLLDVGQMAHPVWSDRFELAIDDLDQLNDQIVAPVVARIDPVILFIEGQPKRAPRSGATTFVLQGIPLMYSSERDKYEEAGRLFEQAMAADPNSAKAIAWSAHWYARSIGQDWAKDPLKAAAKAKELALRAIGLDPESSEALGICAHFSAFLDKDFDTALHYFDRALRLNPNAAFVWAMSAPTYCYVGQADRALQHMDRYRELAPFDPHFRFLEGIYTMTYLFKGDYENAAKVGRRAVSNNPAYTADYKPLIAALGHLGQREEAGPYVQKLLSLEPSFRVEKFGKVYPFQRDEDRQRYIRGLELAGVPMR